MGPVHVPRATIVVAPRERYSTVIETLEELFRTVSESDEIIVVEGGSPSGIKSQIRQYAIAERIRWVEREEPVLPNVARNVGVELARGEYVVFVDNDIRFEAGWLDALVARAEADSADVVAPLICIGPPRATTIHHAGGVLVAEKGESGVEVREKHRLMNVPLSDFDPDAAPTTNTVSEFHCFLARKSFLNRIGPLDERLITREQMDFALRALVHEAVVRFERDAVVTYFAYDKFSRSDLSYHLFRWSDQIAQLSIRSFEETWGLELDAQRIRFRWIARHRERAVRSAFPVFSRLAPAAVFRLFLRALERRADKQAHAAIRDMAPGHSIPKDSVLEAIQKIEATPHVG